MKAIIFPGQGSQSVGMGLELYNNFDLVKKIFEEADDKLKYPLSKIILEGPDSELKLTKNTQPAIIVRCEANSKNNLITLIKEVDLILLKFDLKLNY